MLVLNAYAKLNLSLDITGIREDGYHQLDTIMQSISLCDTVVLEKANEISVTMDVGYVSERQNTAYLAAKIFAEKTGVAGARIHITKRIPAKAGLGGASADAAAVLIGLNSLYKNNLSSDALAEMGLSIGTDVPFSLTGGMARATGIGEVVNPLFPTTPFYYVVIKPHDGVSTAEAYSRYTKSVPVRMATVQFALLKGDLSLFMRYAGNALSLSALSIAPGILQSCEALMAAGATRAFLSGSGSSIFSPFATFEQAHNVALSVKGDYQLCGAFLSEKAGVKIVQGAENE